MTPFACRLRAAPVLALIVGLSLTTACTPAPRSVEELPPELQRTLVASIRAPGASVPDATTFTFLPKSHVLVEDDRVTPSVVDRRVREAIESAFREHGCRLVPRGEAQILVGYIAALENPLDAVSVSRLLGLDPGLLPVPTGDSYDRGTLILEVARAGSNQPIWRGAAQAHWDLDLPEHIREERLRQGAARLVEELYR